MAKQFQIRNEEEALKYKERQQKKIREKKRLEIKKKNVYDKMLKHEEIVAFKRSQVAESVKFKRELENEMSQQRREMRSTVARSAAKIDKGSTSSIRSSKKFRLGFDGEPVGHSQSQLEFATVSKSASKSLLLPAVSANRWFKLNFFFWEKI